MTLSVIAAYRSKRRHTIGFSPAAAFRPAAVGAVLLASAFSAHAAETNELLTSMSGDWVGTGKVTKQDDSTEPVRCRAHYSLTPSGSIVHQELKCAADSYRMDLTSDLVNQDGKLEGTWHEHDRQVGGAVVGRIEGDRITTKISGNTFRADVVILTHAKRQTIALTSDSGNYAKAVDVDLHAQ